MIPFLLLLIALASGGALLRRWCARRLGVSRVQEDPLEHAGGVLHAAGRYIPGAAVLFFLVVYLLNARGTAFPMETGQAAAVLAAALLLQYLLRVWVEWRAGGPDRAVLRLITGVYFLGSVFFVIYLLD
ncbi:hypothetical protein [Alkalicoccus urumqiensis]|nr:hypothetical protein [Alkalicoccus urumqiensis]